MRLSSFHGGHSSFGDGEGEVLAIARAARDKGFEAFGFSEHFDCPPLREAAPGDAPRLIRPQSWMQKYVAAVHSASDQLRDELPIFLGAEIEFVRGKERWTRDRLAELPFDYLVGSVHYVEIESKHIIIDSSRELYEKAESLAESSEQLALLYYEHIEELLNWDFIDVVGHMDLIKIFNPSLAITDRIRSQVDGILETMRDRGVKLDVNPAGLSKPCREIYPDKWILRKGASVGVTPTLGDDSHSAETVGRDLGAAVSLLRATGHRAIGVLVEKGHWEKREL